MLLFRKKRRMVQNLCPNVLLFLGWQSHTYANVRNTGLPLVSRRIPSLPSREDRVCVRDSEEYQYLTIFKNKPPLRLYLHSESRDGRIPGGFPAFPDTLRILKIRRNIYIYIYIYICRDFELNTRQRPLFEGRRKEISSCKRRIRRVYETLENTRLTRLRRVRSLQLNATMRPRLTSRLVT